MEVQSLYYCKKLLLLIECWKLIISINCNKDRLSSSFKSLHLHWHLLKCVAVGKKLRKHSDAHCDLLILILMDQVVTPDRTRAWSSTVSQFPCAVKGIEQWKVCSLVSCTKRPSMHRMLKTEIPANFQPTLLLLWAALIKVVWVLIITRIT